jgi:anti-sigma B factor antagonist/stage II sporulation protein AA (anti-sigma F factor antagonist)
VEITSRAYADVVVVAPAGRIDHTTAPAFERFVVPLLEPSSGAAAGLVFDFERVGYISSVGLRVLMIAGRSMRDRDGRLAVAALQPVVAEIMAISRFATVVEIYPTVGAALAAFSPAALAAHEASPGRTAP